MVYSPWEVSTVPVVKYHIDLTDKERNRLIDLISKGKGPARMIMHANVLLAADVNNTHRPSEREIAEQFHVNYQTVHSVRRNYATKGLDAALGRKKRKTPPVPAKITGDIEARLIAISCTTPPKGRNNWTLRMLADKAVELHIIDSISYEAVRQVLRKTNSSPICTNAG